MALFDINLLFFHAGTAYGFTAGEYQSLVGDLSISSSCTSSTINLGVQEDLGIGDGEFIPKIDVTVGSSGITSSCTSLLVNFQFQGSSDSSTWNLYAETGYNPTSSYTAGTKIFNQDVPRRPTGAPLPQYYRIQMGVLAQITGSAQVNTVGISTGSLLGGIVIQRPDSAGTLDQYPANFTVV